MHTRITPIVTLLLLWSVDVLAADQPPLPPQRGPQAADPSLLPPQRGPQAEKFYNGVLVDFRTLLGDLAGLQVKYRTANEEKQAEIQLQWKELMAQGEKIAPKLVAAAEAAYAEAPNTDPWVAEFLVRLVAQKGQCDDYEPAARIGKLLMENKCQAKPLANWVGIAAFVVSDFDAAEKYLGQAKEAGFYELASQDDKLAQLGQAYLRSLGYYKKAWETEKAIRTREAEADNLPRVLLRTVKGDIELELFENEAPNTVRNFINLVQKGFYDGLTFHRVLAGFVAQGGCPIGNGKGGPGYSIPCECYRPDHRLNFRGSLSMAHAGRDTGGSQFFITFVPTPQLDGKHTVFGRVIGGMDVLAKLQRRDPDEKDQPRPDKILEAKVLRKRPHEYLPQKMPE